MTNIVVLVSGDGTNLQALLDAERSGHLPGGKIVGVISSRSDAYALQRARDAALPSFVIPKKEYPSHTEYSLALLSKCRDLNAKLIVLAGFVHILTEEFVNAYENAILNVHPSLIPSFCGPGYYGIKVHEAVLAYGIKITGATVHFVSKYADEGPVILQRPVKVYPDDTAETLQQRVKEEAEWRLLPRAAALFCLGRLRIEGRRVRIIEEVHP